MKLKSNVIVTALAVVVAALLPVPLTTGALQETATSGDDAAESYIVLLDAEPILEYDGGVEGFGATATKDGNRPDPRSETAKEYRGHLKRLQNKAVSSVGVAPEQIINRYQYTLVGFSALLTESEVVELRRNDGVLAVQRDVLYELSSQEEPDEGRKGTAATPDNREDAGPEGDGVVVGIIDTGIWPEHPSFADNGNFDDPPGTWRSSACNFGSSDYNPDDTDFECNNKLIGARDLRATYSDLLGAEIYRSARDYTGHGTQTAAIAAGNRSVPTTVLGEEMGPISGVAPQAHIAAYSACGALGCYASDVTAAVDRAVADGVDVINYSIVGGAAPTSTVGIALLKAVSAGVSVATAAGNAGPGASTVGSPGTEPWVTTVAANTQGRSFAAAITIDGERFVGASVTAGTDKLTVIDGADRGNPRCDPTIDFEPALNGEIVLCSRGAVQRIAKSRAISEQGGEGMILYNQNRTQSLVTDSHTVPTINVDFETGTAIKKMIASAEGRVSAVIEGLGRRPGGETSVPTFSSRGPVEGGILKPDVSAPGNNVLTATTPTPMTGPSDELFQTVSGTSMSSAHVAGLMTLLIEANPDWSPAAVKSALMTTADNDNGTDNPFASGAGAVAPDQGDTNGSTPFEPGVVFDIDPDDYTGYLCETAAWAVTGDTCAEGESDEVITPSDLNQPSIAIENVTGETSVTRTITNVSDETISLSAEIAAPQGVDVEISPTDVSLRSGESATFEVTVTIEDGAETDSWSNGSITWVQGDGQSAEVITHIPMVIQPVALEAPNTVTGQDAQATVDISFGYDGAFDVSTYGLTAPTTISDTVGQDGTPEDSSPRFRRSDGRHGGATAHEIELSDAAHLRLVLDKDGLSLPEGTSENEVDLDLYLYDSEGEQVARSTAGGTDELIDISFPKDDTYTLYVHGWAVGDEEVGYALEQWVIPAETDGSLEITEAPTSASTGDAATIQLGWVAEDFDNGLGVVVYEGPDGRLALTLVESH